MELKIGDIVYIPDILREVKEKCKNDPSVGWCDEMESILGKSGSIVRVDPNKYCVVFQNNIDYVFPKEALELWVMCFPNDCTIKEGQSQNTNPVIAKIKYMDHKWATQQLRKGMKGEFYDKMLCV